MSIHTNFPTTTLRVICDKCASHYEVPNTQQAMTAAHEHLTKRGWRTIVRENRQDHYCGPCAAKMPEFNARSQTKKVKAAKGALTKYSLCSQRACREGGLK